MAILFAKQGAEVSIIELNNVTAGGLLFIEAIRDNKFRAFNERKGELLFETELPAPGYAAPLVYRVNIREFIVIACGRIKNKSGDTYVAFALPTK